MSQILVRDCSLAEPALWLPVQALRPPPKAAPAAAQGTQCKDIVEALLSAASPSPYKSSQIH